jgi:hypothetical protein
MIVRRRAFLAATGAALLVPRALAQRQPGDNFPPGGRGGRVIRVTTLRPDGPGSITDAIKTEGPRIVVFEVGGVIDLGRTTLKIRESHLTIAGLTAPSPGVTFIRGGIEIGQGCTNVVISHIAVRPGEAGAEKKSGWECDGIYAYGASDVYAHNCSITWATDEGLSASGKRFGLDNKGATLADWRAATSHNIYFFRNLVAEGLSNSTHSKGEHSKGTLIHDNVRNAQIGQSLYAHNMERNVLFKGGAQGFMSRCVAYNPGKRFAHYNLHEGEWEGHAHETGDIIIAGNVFLAGPSTDKKAAAFMLGGEGDLELDMHENWARTASGEPLALTGAFGSGKAKLIPKSRSTQQKPDLMPESSANNVVGLVLASAGMRPLDRDPVDARIVAEVRNRTGKIIDSEQEVGGYPVRPGTRAAFRETDWNLDTMERKA